MRKRLHAAASDGANDETPALRHRLLVALDRVGCEVLRSYGLEARFPQVRCDLLQITIQVDMIAVGRVDRRADETDRSVGNRGAQPPQIESVPMLTWVNLKPASD